MNKNITQMRYIFVLISYYTVFHIPFNMLVRAFLVWRCQNLAYISAIISSFNNLY